MLAPKARPGRKTRSARPAAIATPVPPAQADGGSAASRVPRLESEAVARLAYSYWEARGGRNGSPEEDWFRAEQELGKR